MACDPARLDVSRCGGRPACISWKDDRAGGDEPRLEKRKKNGRGDFETVFCYLLARSARDGLEEDTGPDAPFVAEAQGFGPVGSALTDGRVLFVVGGEVARARYAVVLARGANSGLARLMYLRVPAGHLFLAVNPLDLLADKEHSPRSSGGCRGFARRGACSNTHRASRAQAKCARTGRRLAGGRLDPALCRAPEEQAEWQGVDNPTSGEPIRRRRRARVRARDLRQRGERRRGSARAGR